MASPHQKLNRASQAGAEKAARHLDALTRAYGRALRAAGRRAATRMRQTAPVTAAANPEWTPPPVDSLIDQEELVADTRRKTGKLHRLMLADAAQAALDPFGISFDIHAPTSQALLDAVGQRIQDGITATIREQIVTAVQAGYENGDSVYRVSTAIQKATDEISRPRADMLARTDLNALANGGSLLAATISEGASTKTWLATSDDRTRETHAEADGQTVPIDQPFDVGGEQAQFPGDPDLSDDEACNCRCSISYGEPLTASSTPHEALPRDFAAWRDHAWEGAPEVANQPSTDVPSGGTMSDTTEVTLDVAAMTETERDELRALLDAPPEPFQVKLAAVKAHLSANAADGLGDDELRAVLLTLEALGLAGTISPTLVLNDFALRAAAVDGGTPWQATLCLEGVPAVDSGLKRLLAEGSIDFLPLPLPLAIMDASPHADLVTSSPVCGRIDRIWKAGNKWQATGVFADASDDPSIRDAGARAAAMVGEQLITGISVDLVDVEAELMVYDGAAVTSLEDLPEMCDMPIGDANLPNDIPDAEPAEIEDADEVEYVMVFTSAKIAGATICPVQALTDATIAVVAGGADHIEWRSETEFVMALTAAAAGLVPVEPPAAWFNEPEHDGPTPLTVTDDGQVYGHLALWGTCHTGKPGVCVTPPRSPSEYRNFHRGEIRTAEGDRIPVGVLTMNTGHAGLRMNAGATIAHYDDTGTVGAHIRASDGAHGIWLAGALNPKLAAEDARVLMAAPPSGDWRELNRGEGLDLFAALAVNAQGFPVPRPAARLVASGAEMERVALVAAGRLEMALAPAEFARQLEVLAASADGIEGLAALAAA